MRTPPTLNQMLERGNFGNGRLAKIVRRMTAYTLDGRPYGDAPFESLSGSLNDFAPSQKRGEAATVAHVLSRLGIERADLRTIDSSGKELQKPDLDVVLDEGRVGVEVADAVQTPLARKAAAVSMVQREVLDALGADKNLKAALGKSYLIVSLQSPLTVPANSDLGTKHVRPIVDELKRFLLAGEHRTTLDRIMPFDGKYPALCKRAATFRSSLLKDTGTIAVSAGVHFISQGADTMELIDTLNKHCKKAAKYRPGPNWIVLYLSDGDEIVRGTIEAIGQNPPPFDPFTRCFISDSAGGCAELTAAGITKL